MKRVDPREQFSKRLAGRAEWFWFFYMLVLAAVMVLQPASALPAVYLGIMVTGVMIVSVFAYTKNSIDEKWFYWLAEIAKAVGGKKGASNDEEGVNEDSEGGDNG